MRRFAPFTLMLCALALDSSAQSEKPLINSGTLIAEAIKLHDDGKYKEAIANYKKISRNDTNYVYALYEAALSLNADSQFVAAVKLCEEGLRQTTEREREHELYNQLGISLDYAGEVERSLRVFDSAIQKYPAYPNLYFSKGVTLLRAKRYPEAEKSFQQALLINPYYTSAHFRLGQVAVYTGRPVEGLMALAVGLMIQPGGAHQSNTIRMMSEIANANDEVVNFARNRSIENPANFQEVENILFSKISLNKAYKPLLKLDDPISRQLQVICEKLEYDAADKNFWMQYYVPMMKWMLEDKRFEVFINEMFSTINVESIQKYVKSHKKEIAKFTEEAAVYLDEIKQTRTLDYATRKKADQRYQYENNGYGYGKLVNNVNLGSWNYFFNPGNKKAEGAFDSKGEKMGTWKYYNVNGTIKSIVDHNGGELEGNAKYYYSNGNLSETGTNVKGKSEGELKVFNYAGGPLRISNYKNDELDGIEKTFYSSGALHEEKKYVAGKLQGKTITYYTTGQLESEVNFTAGEADGAFVMYHPNGKKSAAGTYVAGKIQGELKAWYENGQLKSTENYNKSNYDGECSYWHENGALNYKVNYKQGSFDGDLNYYDDDNKLYSTLSFVKTELVTAKYFSKAGKELSRSERKGKRLELTSYTADGFKNSTKVYEDGVQVETETYFYRSGEISSTTAYKEGKANGKMINYWSNGKIKNEITMEDGIKNGYSKSYYQDGTIETEGWYRDDEAVDEWIYYDASGAIASTTFYSGGQTHGVTQHFYPSGKIEMEERSYLGWKTSVIHYDSTGRIVSNSDLPSLNGEYHINHFNGNKLMTHKLVLGNIQGDQVRSYFDGSPKARSIFVNDELNGATTYYYYGGQISSTGQFKNGKKDGPWKYYFITGELYSTDTYADGQLNGKELYYFQNGKIDAEYDYVDGTLHGWKKKYDAEGHLMYQLKFDQGVPVAYTYLDKTGKLVPEIALTGGSGEIKAFYDNGKPSSVFGYKNNELHGKDLRYYYSGQLLQEKQSSIGETVGEMVTYHPSGKVKSRKKYNMNRQHGTYKEMNEQGIVVEEGEFYNGEEHGIKKVYDDKGKLLKTYTFYYGELLAVK